VSLKDVTKEWTDFDIAAHQLGIDIGLFHQDEAFQTDLKWVFWSDNPVGNMLYQMLRLLAETGVLERDEESMQYRWKEGATAQTLDKDAY
jgi:hypothetical protein